MRHAVLMTAILLLGCAGLLPAAAPWPELSALADDQTRRACAEGDAAACDQIATRARSAASDAEQAALYELLQQACPAGSRVSCLTLGQHFVYDLKFDPTPVRAQSALARACEAGDPEGCYYAGSILEEGMIGAPDEAGAFTLFEQGCALRHPDCCGWLGLKYEFGRGVAKDRERAYEVFQKGCQLGEAETSCYNEAMHRNERGEDIDTVVALFARACAAGNATACENAQRLRP